MKTKMESQLDRVLTSVNELTAEVAALKLEIVCLKEHNKIMAERIEFLKNCHMHPDTRYKFEKIISRDGIEL